MSEPGQYQGKRLSATEVTRLYAAGERDFSGAVLRGCNFRGVDLSGADFSGADIRSARFVEATLRGVNFSHARAGLQRLFLIGKDISIFLFIFSSGFLLGISGAMISILLTSNDEINLIGSILILTGISGTFFIIYRKGFTLAAMGNIAATVGVAFSVSILISDKQPFLLFFSLIFAASSALSAAIAFASAFSFSVVGWEALIIVSATGAFKRHLRDRA